MDGGVAHFHAMAAAPAPEGPEPEEPEEPELMVEEYHDQCDITDPVARRMITMLFDRIRLLEAAQKPGSLSITWSRYVAAVNDDNRRKHAARLSRADPS